MDITRNPEVAQGDWLTPRDVQRELRIKERLCYKLLQNGEIPSVRVGNLYRIRRETIEDLKDQAMHRIGV